MSDFNVAFNKVMAYEGGYANDSSDRGGETYAGVARNFWPEWDGWAIIDELKDTAGFPANLVKSTVLSIHVREFYKANFWGRYGEVNSQRLATSLFDCAVNCGIAPANRMMQRALNIPDDGVFGKQSIKCINEADETATLANFNAEREKYYRGIVERNPSQGKFLAGWLKRLDIG